MTDRTATDAEISSLYAEQTGFDLSDSPAALLDFARAVLAKWGTPVVAGEVAAHRVMRKQLDGNWVCDGRYWSDGPPSKELVESICSDKDRWRVDVAYLTPQPTHAQAGAVPLTDAHIRAMLNKHPPEDVCGWSYRMGIDDAELHHGIKGGQP